MIGKIPENHPHEYPIVHFWYTKHKGWTIEKLIDWDVSFFEWCVRTFQDVTPAQAAYYEKKTGWKIPNECIRDVTPYEWVPGDGEMEPYMTICKTGDLEGTLLRFRGRQFDMFETQV